MRDDLWGPWIEHDGKGCPCKGIWANWEFAIGIRREGLAGMNSFSPIRNETVGPARGGMPSAWDWQSMIGHLWSYRVIRYRMRKPRALLQLIEMVENLPAHQKEDA